MEYDVYERSEATEAAYRSRATWLNNSAAKKLGLPSPSHDDVCTYLVGIRAGIARSTWRQYKSALIFYLNSVGTTDSMVASNKLKEQGQSECLKTTSRTSGRRKKNISNKAFDDLISTLKLGAKKRKHVGTLILWLMVGRLTGLRPHEWKNAEIVNNQSKDETSNILLKVKNSKNTNNRSHGNFRHIDITDFDETSIQMVSEFCDFMRLLGNTREYDKVYYCCSYYLRVANKAMHGSRSKWIQLYSPRHKFSSDNKLIFSKEEVAALMGHATDRTASVHYGRKSFGSGGSLVRPIAEEVVKIRRVGTRSHGQSGVSAKTKRVVL